MLLQNKFKEHHAIRRDDDKFISNCIWRAPTSSVHVRRMCKRSEREHGSENLVDVILPMDKVSATCEVPELEEGDTCPVDPGLEKRIFRAHSCEIAWYSMFRRTKCHLFFRQRKTTTPPQIFPGGVN
ncbi:hypothetical protein CEXT_402271 [Caerostris extrusa]|uniref:Uncharacterized protein n=1 Tax=Caerostris extrusa TaxID=172846 RepID=A0AAV4PEM8_CAEEX|nr:hypothetical protein CEXT_402271 [Caerostris extrusa]